ncbi:armadillo-type protein [Roridomyces roridus]|uniref:Armadillo-type protein n=1 Tax=Roridomyces roridus TaxID=1738132 RepID=A0AAD7F690_9AGAR|nr:armadillo-type protein [Roridomyces roridus]
MSSSSTVPPDVAQAIALIQAAYAPPSSATPAAIQAVQGLQVQLLTLQRTPASWGLILPLLAFPGDANVQFFGAHTAHAKIARGELDSLTEEQQIGLRDALLEAAGVTGRPRVVRRKLYAALGALALRLTPGNGASEGQWPGWVQGTVEVLVRAGEPSAHVHEFLAGAAEDVSGANLLPQAKIEMIDSLRSAAQLVLQSIGTVLAASSSTQADPDPAALPAALACLTAWLPAGILPGQDIARLVPPLIALLPNPSSPTPTDKIKSEAAAITLCELLGRPPAAWGARVLLEPLFVWTARAFAFISPGNSEDESLDRRYSPHAPPPDAARALRSSSKLLVALGEAGVEWVAGSIVDPTRVALTDASVAGTSQMGMEAQGPTRGFLARHFLRVMLALTAVDHDDEDEDEDEEGDSALGFWYLLQEALWEIPEGNEYEDDGEDGEPKAESPAQKARAAHSTAAYAALVRVLRSKVVWRRGWGKERVEKFPAFRRDVGDTLVNAYYVLRDDLLVFYVADVQARIDAGRGWEDVEATLHCLRAVHEALDPDSAGATPALSILFGPQVFGRLPAGYARVRRTALGLVDTYSGYFATQPPAALGAALRYVLGALTDAEPGVCLQAALALRSLCDANRRALAAQIGAFAEVHAGIGGVPDSEKAKVLQSIASVIQALPPTEGIAPVEALVGPVLQRLGEALGAAGMHPEAAQQAAILQLDMLTGIAKGLTRATDVMAFDDDDGGGVEGAAVRVAREDQRTVAIREALFQAIARVAELWSADAEVGQALSELFRAITALPADLTLLSVPAQPLLGVVCRAAGRRLTGVWLALATILIAQLNPPPMILALQAAPSAEVEACVQSAMGEIVGSVLGVLGAPGGMVENPDIVQEFFACLDRVAQDFTTAFCALPDGAFDALMQCAISALALQERYSLVAACTFLGTFIHRVALYAPISSEQLKPLQAHMIRVHGRAIMRALLCGFAGAAPRSVTSNLLELLAALVTRWDENVVNEAEGRSALGGGGARGWVPSVVFADDFYPSRAGREAKERFVKTVVSSRSVKKTKEAANQFVIVAWGLEGSSFGYSSVSSG